MFNFLLLTVDGHENLQELFRTTRPFFKAQQRGQSLVKTRRASGLIKSFRVQLGSDMFSKNLSPLILPTELLTHLSKMFSKYNFYNFYKIEYAYR